MSKLRTLSGGEIITVGPGFVGLFAADSPPEGWLAMNGAEISRAVYSKLFSVIGTRYGVGDGNTTFAIPNAQDRWPTFAGANKAVGALLNPGLPDLQGKFLFADLGTPISVFLNMSGVFPDTTYQSPTQQQLSNTLRVTVENGNRAESVTFRASSYNSIYENSEEVQPKSITFLACIKY